MQVIEISSEAAPYLNYSQSGESMLGRVTSPFVLFLSAEIEQQSSAASYLQQYLPGEKESLIDSIMGKYAYVQTSSEAFAKRKRKDIEME